MDKLAVIFIPQIDTSEISEFRKDYDPSWNIILPHVTLVAPVTGISEEELITHIQTVASHTPTFQVQFAGLEKTDDDYLFLLVQQGREAMHALHDSLYTGILATHEPTEYPFEPHITLGYFKDQT